MAFCSNCGVEIVEGVKFCSSCGKAISGVSNASVASYNHTNETENKNKIKNGLLLCGAILGAIFGAVVAIASITSGNFGGYTTIWVSCGIGAIVFGIMLCVPNLRKNLFLIIAEIAIIIGILTNSLSFVNQQSWFSSYRITGIEALIAFSIIIPLILLVGLIVPYKEIANNSNNSTQLIGKNNPFDVTIDLSANQFQVNVDLLDLREKPELLSNYTSKLSINEIVTIFEIGKELSNNIYWVHVKTKNGKIGWCYSDLLEKL